MSKSLLERAKQQERMRKGTARSTPERVELALAWIRGEVGITQVARALELKDVHTAYIPIVVALRQAYRDGTLKIKK